MARTVKVAELRKGMTVGLPGDSSGRQWVTITRLTRHKHKIWNSVWAKDGSLKSRTVVPGGFTVSVYFRDGLVERSCYLRSDDRPLPVR